MLNLAKDIKPISYVKSHTAEIIRQVGENKNPVVITQNGEAKAVILDVEMYQDLVNAVNLIKIISIGERDIKNNQVVSHEQVKDRIKNILV